MKIVINRCYGGFEISKEAYEYTGRIAKDDRFICNDSMELRTDPKLIEFIEKYGSERASSECSKLVVEEVPKGTFYYIHVNDGKEWIDWFYDYALHMATD